MNLRALAASALVLYLNGHPTWAADCRASLVTGIDASASVGADGLAMQIAGMSDALQSPQVLQAMQSQGCVRVAVFLWSDGPSVVLLPWVDVANADDAARATASLQQAAASYDPPPGVLTDVSHALEAAEAMLGQIPPNGRQVINIVSDGEDNVGEGPQIVAARLKAAGVRVNAVLFGPSATVEQYYRANVTNGFTLRVNGADDFAAIYRAKFLMDLS
jgi:uncharacterized protein DUF1194